MDNKKAIEFFRTQKPKLTGNELRVVKIVEPFCETIKEAK